MKAVLCRELGGLEKLSLENIEDPVPAPGEVVIQVKMAGLNFFDTLMLVGQYQYKLELPFSPGSEGVGVITAIGEGVTAWCAGDRVAAFANNFCRQKVAVPAERLFRVPDYITDEQAASLVVTYGTSLHALRDRAGLKSGESLAVLGAAGGAGLAAVEIGKAIGAKVIACASSATKLELAKACGASMTINYAEESLKERLRSLTDGKGVDVIYDPVGGVYSEAALRSIAWGGRFLVVGFAAGNIPRLPLNLPLLKACDVRGVFWTPFLERNPDRYRENMAQIFAWTKTGNLSPHVHAIFPLAETAKALAILANREARGKVLVRI